MALTTEVGHQYAAQDYRHKCRPLFIGKNGTHTPAKPPEAIPATVELKADTLISGPFALSRNKMPRGEVRRFLELRN